MYFAALPPEINSGRMYSGPGSAPMLAAAAAWDGTAAQMGSLASSYDSEIAGLSGEAWSGPTATSMATAANGYAAWASGMAAQLEQSATQARAAAAAYEAALTAMVPPPTIAANRSLFASLVATNILGQNTAAIFATEAEYMAMWAQDVTAMSGYAAASAQATALPPFREPPPTTNAAGAAGEHAAVANAAAAAGTQTTLSHLASAIPSALQGMAASAPVAQATDPLAGLLSILDALSGPLGPASLYSIGGVPYLLAIQCVLLPMNGSNVVAALTRADGMTKAGKWPPNPFDPGVLSPVQAGAPQLVSSAAPSVSARAGSAGSVGRLSVPQAWTAATPAAKAVAAALPGAGPEAVSLVAANSESGLMSDLALGSLAGRAIGTTGGAASRKVGGVTGSLAGSKPAKPTTATIIVIPPSAED